MNEELAARALALAKMSVGVRESPSNWGKWVKQYLAAVGIYRPAPWCAAFVYFKVQQAARQLGIKANYPRTGYVQAVANWARKNRRVLLKPKPGCLFLVWNDELERYAHIGFVEKVLPKQIVTVEGNSNDTGSREGVEVCSIVRLRRVSYMYVAVD